MKKDVKKNKKKKEIKEKKKMNPFLKAFLILFGIIISIIIIICSIYLITEYRPDKIEKLIVENQPSKNLNLNEEINILTYNIGFLSLDDSQDFFMDGGKGTMPETDKNVNENLTGVKKILNDYNPDIALFQEVDRNSKRSYYMNQVKELSSDFDGTNTYSIFHKVFLVPYPISNPIGKVESGMLSLNKYKNEAVRISLPSAYDFPISVAMFKRNLLKQTIDIENTDKKLIIYNVHMEAYEENNTRIKQLSILRDDMMNEYSKGNYVIAGGDFNAVFPNANNEQYPILDDSKFKAVEIPFNFFPEEWQYINDDTTPTTRVLNKPYSGNYEDTQLYVIDGFVATPNIKVENIKTIDTQFTYSDHNPVHLKITLQ